MSLVQLKSREDAPGLRFAEHGDTGRCGICSHFWDDWCMLYHFEPSSFELCEAFSPDVREKRSEWKDVKLDVKVHEDEKQRVFGWLYVAECKNGIIQVDHSKEIIREKVLEEGSYAYVKDHRGGDRMHGIEKLDGKRDVMSLIECMIFTREKIEAMGLPRLGSLPVGIWAGYHVHDSETWGMFKSKKLSMFSIGFTHRTRALKVFKEGDNA